MSPARATGIGHLRGELPVIRAGIAHPRSLATLRRPPQSPTICKVIDQCVDLAVDMVEQDEPLRQTLSHEIWTILNVTSRLTSNARRAPRDLDQMGRA